MGVFWMEVHWHEPDGTGAVMCSGQNCQTVLSKLSGGEVLLTRWCHAGPASMRIPVEGRHPPPRADRGGFTSRHM